MGKKLAKGGVYAVILVGGKGKRLRPLSTNSRPKAFLSVTRDRKSLFRKTLERAMQITCRENVVIAANRKHKALIRSDFHGVKRENLILEPFSRNTAPAIAYAAAVLKQKDEEAIMVVLPADQYLIGEYFYISAVRSGIEFIKNNPDALVVLGVKPTFPATGYGYLKIKRQRAKNIYAVEEFVEKPDLGRAKRFLKERRYLWNAGAFIFKAKTIIRALKKFAPEIASAFENLKETDKRYRRLKDISIDYAVMEHASNIYCVRGLYGWRDVGSFESLKEVLIRESRDFVEKSGKIVKIV